MSTNATPQRTRFWVGEGDDALYAHAHLPRAARQSVVLLVPPLGYEYLHFHRTLRSLADQLAKAGHIAVRFDFHGTGNSAGCASQPERLIRWVEDISTMKRCLATWQPQAQLSVVGVRMGATLAALAATRDETLVLWNPCVKGKRFMREIRALGLVSQDSGAGDGWVESGGCCFTEETSEALSKIDLTTQPIQVHSALLLEKSGRKPNAALHANLQAHANSTMMLRDEGFDEALIEPHNTQLPMATLQQITDWLSIQVAPSSPGGHRGQGAVTRPELPVQRDERANEFVEELLDFGDIRGILTRPSNGSLEKMLVLANGGSIHSVGPNRLYVDLARTLASRGLASFRFDLRNLGDSANEAIAQENFPYPDTAIADLSYVLDCLVERGVQNMVLGGLCAGAYHAFALGKFQGHRHVRELLMINPLTFEWREGLSLDIPPEHETIRQEVNYGNALRDPAKWRRALSGGIHYGKLLRFVARYLTRGTSRGLATVLRWCRLVQPPQLALDLQQIAARGLKCRFIFADRDPGYGILRTAGEEVLQRLEESKALSVQLIEQADHTFKIRAKRQELIDRITAQLTGQR